jgi:hypothetical protein
MEREKRKEEKRIEEKRGEKRELREFVCVCEREEEEMRRGEKEKK